MKTKIFIFLMSVITAINLNAGERQLKDEIIKNNEIDIAFWIVLFCAIILLGSTLLLYKEYNYLKGQNLSHRPIDSGDVNNQFKYSESDFENLHKRIETLESEKKSLNNEIEELKSKNSLQVEKNSKPSIINNVESEFKEQFHKEIISTPNPINEQPIEQVFYASNIDSDGYFDIDDLKTHSEENEFYKITVFNNNAEFEFYNNKYSIETGIEYINDYIKPFCYETNFQTETITRIVTLKKGTLQKVGNRWKVQLKAEIKYE